MYEVIFEIPEKHISGVLEVFADAWWTKDRAEEDVRTMLANTDVLVGIVHKPTDTLVGFARAFSDGVFKAILMDVIVRSSYRGKGVFQLLMDNMFGHPELRGVKDFELYCRPELVEPYGKWGFKEAPLPTVFLRATPRDSIPKRNV